MADVVFAEGLIHAALLTSQYGVAREIALHEASSLPAATHVWVIDENLGRDSRSLLVTASQSSSLVTTTQVEVVASQMGATALDVPVRSQLGLFCKQLGLYPSWQVSSSVGAALQKFSSDGFKEGLP